MSLLTLPLDVQRLIVNEYLCNEDAAVARCACRALRALVPRARIDACRYRLYAYFCEHGHVALLAWLVQQVPLRESSSRLLCEKAAAGGHVGMLRWLREHGAPWDEWTCAQAAAGGHLAVLEWSRLLAGERLRASTARPSVCVSFRKRRNTHHSESMFARANVGAACWCHVPCASARPKRHVAVPERKRISLAARRHVAARAAARRAASDY